MAELLVRDEDDATVEDDAAVVVSFYKYVAIADPEAHAAWQRARGAALDLRGRIIVAKEGINGTLSGASSDCDAYAAELRAVLATAIDVKRSRELAADARRPFPDLYVKVGGEIVSTGMGPGVRVEGGAPHAPAEAFRDKLLAPDASERLLVLDVRNGFEFDVGHFRGAERAPIRTMNEWATYVDRADVVGRAEGKEILMYCTGGVRCEKASAYLKSKGVAAVHQLDGGIHRFLEAYPDGGEVWEGRNFLFDAREADAYADEAATASKASDASGADARAVGTCTDCGAPWGAHAPRNICSVCETLCLVCPSCSRERHEHYCDAHADLRGAYCHFLDVFDARSLRAVEAALADALDAPKAQQSVNRRRAIRKQLARVAARLAALDAGDAAAVYDGPPRCRSCGQTRCDGCWGFWKACAADRPAAQRPQ